MLSNFINPWMLFGLLGMALPILAHLLSKKKFDVVEWGAMQFLELGQNARRKIRLEQLLLLLLRMGLIALIAIALARPWAEGGVFSKVGSKQNRDVVLVIDGSYSMGWEGRSTTPHTAAIRWARNFLEDLRAGDTVAIIDARDQARLVIESPTSDFNRVRQELDALPPPSGTSNLAEAMRKAVQILSTTSNLSREVVVITDGQAKCWQPQDNALWTLYDKMLDEPSIKPRTWVVDVGIADVKDRTNFSLDPIVPSRELTAVGYPIRIKTKIHYTGGKAPASRNVFFEVNGQRLADKTQVKTISPDGEVSVEIEHRFAKAGSHLVSVVLDKDNLPGDNRSDAAITVTEALPVLLVDGDPHPGEPIIKSETVFAASALTPEENKAPWVKAEVLSWRQLDTKLNHLTQYEAVFLANVPRLSDGQIKALQDYVQNGGGLFFALGDKVDAAHYNMKLFAKGQGLFPVRLKSIEKNEDESKPPVTVTDGSLSTPWLSRFESRYKGGFTEARYMQWWLMELPTISKTKLPAGKNGANDAKQTTSASSSPTPVVLARLNNKAPFLVSQKQARGHVVVMNVPLDADWGYLQTKQDFTPFLHEVVFFLASSRPARNVQVGTPLRIPIDENTETDQHVFFAPDGKPLPAVTGGTINGRRIQRLDDTSLPGIYQYRRKTDSDKPDLTSPPEYFVVNFDRSESDLTPLTEEDRTTLAKDETKKDNTNETPAENEKATSKKRMSFFKSREALIKEMFKDNSTGEFWYILLLIFLGVLIFEVVMTRRMVQGGHVYVDEEPPKQNRTISPPPLPPNPSGRGFDEDFLADSNLAPASGGRGTG
ncbi:MAG: hypothetical protein Tsb009_12850 [Planctomycetaceae bacterium]